MNEKLFQYIIYWIPTKEESIQGEKIKILVETQSIFADNLKEANSLAKNDIPEPYKDKLSQINIAVRPF